MCPANVSGMVTGDAPTSYFHNFFLFLATVPEVFAKVKLDPVLFSYLKKRIVVKSELKQRHF